MRFCTLSVRSGCLTDQLTKVKKKESYMRLFNVTQENTTKGVQTFDSERLYFGSQSLEFHRSLYTTRGATFGNSLMFGTLICGLDKVYRLHGCTIDSHQISGLDALVVLTLPLQADGKIVVPKEVYGARVLLGHETAVVLRDDPEIRSFHALVVLKAGSSVDLTESFTVANRQMAAPVPVLAPALAPALAPTGKRRRRKGAQAPASRSAQAPVQTRVTRLAFDGDRVTITAV